MQTDLDMRPVFDWLDQNQLTANAREYWEISLAITNSSISEHFLLYSSSDSIWNKSETLTQAYMTKQEWDNIREENTPVFDEYAQQNEKEIVNEVLEKPSRISVDIKRLPPDYMAFYRPFHYRPYHEWGIYFVLPKYLRYVKAIMNQLRQRYSMFKPEVVATLVLYEVFHHEHYHHLVESTAFTLETILTEFGLKRPVYIPYNRIKLSTKAEQYTPHVPLEEALANAYAYNSISFAQRTKSTFDKGVMKAYQAVIKKHWMTEPAGYRDAENYIGDKRVEGNTSLLKIMMGSEPNQNTVAVEKIVSRVMPSGYTSMVPKPAMPTYFLGNKDDFLELIKFLPNPKAAYAYLEFPFMTNKISDIAKVEKERRKKANKTVQ